MLTIKKRVQLAVKLLDPLFTSKSYRSATEELLQSGLERIEEILREEKARQQIASAEEVLSQLQSSLNKVVNLVGQLPPILSAGYQGLERFVSTPARQLRELPKGPGHRTSLAQYEAVFLASSTLSFLDVPLKTTRTGYWHKLSAILAGRQNLVLQRHLSRMRPRAVDYAEKWKRFKIEDEARFGPDEDTEIKVRSKKRTRTRRK